MKLNDTAGLLFGRSDKPLSVARLRPVPDVGEGKPCRDRRPGAVRLKTK